MIFELNKKKPVFNPYHMHRFVVVRPRVFTDGDGNRYWVCLETVERWLVDGGPNGPVWTYRTSAPKDGRWIMHTESYLID